MENIDLFVTRGDLPGEVDLQWDSIPESVAYSIEVSRKTKNPRWKLIDITDESHYTITGLKRSREYMFRVAVIYNRKRGPWCKAVIKRAI